MPYSNVPDDKQDKMESCVMQVTEKNGGDKESAIAICYKSVVEEDGAAKAALKAVGIVLDGEIITPAPSYFSASDAVYYQTGDTAIKAAGDWELDVLYMPYNGQKGGRDVDGEYFSEQTAEHADKFPNPMILYYHGFAKKGVMQESPAIIGQTVKRWTDKAGRWMRVTLDRGNEYARKVWDAAKAGTARASSGSITHLVRKAKDGHLLNWPVVEVSLFDTGDGKAPANSYAIAMPAAKAHGVNIPREFDPAYLEVIGATVGAVVAQMATKHYGPGNHPDGSPQEVHAGGDMKSVKVGSVMKYKNPTDEEKGLEMIVLELRGPRVLVKSRLNGRDLLGTHNENLEDLELVN